MNVIILFKLSKNKEIMATAIRDTQRKLLAHIEDIQLPELTLLLNDKYASIQKQEFVCDICKKSFDSKRGLGHHKKRINKYFSKFHKQTNKKNCI